MAGQLQLVSLKYKKNAYIMVEGKSSSNCFYIVREGRVLISRDMEVVEEEGGNILGPGDTFGVISAMSTHSCVESAMALTDVTLISVQKDQYDELIRRNTPVAMKIIRQFSQRLRFLDDALSRRAAADTKKPDTSSPLFQAANYYVSANRYNHAYYAYQQYIKHYPGGEHTARAREQMNKIAIKVKPADPPRQGINEMERTYPKDSLIFAEGEPGDELYIIRKGAVKICKIMDKNEVILAVLNPGDIFGEMALLEDKPRMAAAVVYEEYVLPSVLYNI